MVEFILNESDLLISASNLGICLNEVAASCEPPEEKTLKRERRLPRFVIRPRVPFSDFAEHRGMLLR
jgi:hypothetical protein